MAISDPENDDLIYGTLISSKGALHPPEFRQKYGASELLFVSAMGLQMVHDVLATATVLQFGTEALARERTLIALALREPSGMPSQERQDLEQRLTRAPKLTQRAEEIARKDFAPLNDLVLVNLCAAFEVYTEDLILALLRFQPGTVARLEALGLSRLGVPSGRDLSYDEATKVAVKLKRWARTDLPAPEGTLKMLGTVGVELSLPDEHRLALREMIYLRNCILHRDHRPGGQDRVEVRGLRLEQGKKFVLSRSLMGRFARASIEVASRIAEAGRPVGMQ